MGAERRIQEHTHGQGIPVPHGPHPFDLLTRSVFLGEGAQERRAHLQDHINDMAEEGRWLLLNHEIARIGEHIAQGAPFGVYLYDRTPHGGVHDMFVLYEPPSANFPRGRAIIEVPDDPEEAATDSQKRNARIPTMLHGMEAIVEGVQIAQQRHGGAAYPDFTFVRRPQIEQALQAKPFDIPIMLLPLEIDPEVSNVFFLHRNGKAFNMLDLVKAHYAALQQDGRLIEDGWRHTMLRKGPAEAVNDKTYGWVGRASHELTMIMRLMDSGSLNNIDGLIGQTISAEEVHGVIAEQLPETTVQDVIRRTIDGMTEEQIRAFLSRRRNRTGMDIQEVRAALHAINQRPKLNAFWRFLFS